MRSFSRLCLHFVAFSSWSSCIFVLRIINPNPHCCRKHFRGCLNTWLRCIIQRGQMFSSAAGHAERPAAARCTTTMLPLEFVVTLNCVTQPDATGGSGCVCYKPKEWQLFTSKMQQSSWLVGRILSSLTGSDFWFHRPPRHQLPFSSSHPPLVVQMFLFSPSDSDNTHTQECMSVTSALSSFILAQTLTHHPPQSGPTEELHSIKQWTLIRCINI